MAKVVLKAEVAVSMEIAGLGLLRSMENALAQALTEAPFRALNGVFTIGVKDSEVVVVEGVTVRVVREGDS